MADLIFSADPTVWVPDLGAQVRAQLDAGRLVLSRSVSGATLLLANVSVDPGIDTVGIRHNRHDPFGTDGLPLGMGLVSGTSCGLVSTSGYRSSRPVTIHAYAPDDPGVDPEALYEVWKARLRELAAGDEPLAWLEQIPEGHPDEGCLVAHCPVRDAEVGR